MNSFEADILGYIAAIITNISIYPQAYLMHTIIKLQNYDELDAISLPTFALHCIGCTLWLIYGFLTSTYPLVMGSILCIIPSGYITVCIIIYKPTNTDSQISSISSESDSDS